MNKKDFTQKDFENWIANKPSAAESDGAWGRFVESNKKFETENSQQPVKKPKIIDYIEKTREKYNDPILEDRGKQTIALKHTVNKYLNNQVKKGNIKKEDLMLQPDKNGLLTNKAKTIAMRDSFMAKQFNNALGVNDYPAEASPEQFANLAYKLERDRQMRGAPTDTKKFADGFKNRPKTFVKKKISTPMEPVKIDISPTYFPPMVKRDPEMELANKRFEKLSNDIREEKYKNTHSGIAGLVGGDPKYYGK